MCHKSAHVFQFPDVDNIYINYSSLSSIFKTTSMHKDRLSTPVSALARFGKVSKWPQQGVWQVSISMARRHKISQILTKITHIWRNFTKTCIPPWEKCTFLHNSLPRHIANLLNCKNPLLNCAVLALQYHYTSGISVHFVIRCRLSTEMDACVANKVMDSNRNTCI